jgi:hypothetical protein
MPEVRGKSIDKKNASLDLIDGVVEITIKPGMFIGKGESVSIPLDEILSVESKGEVKPFPDAQWVLIKHTAGSVEFFSINKVSLLGIIREINEFIETKEKKLQEAKDKFKNALDENVGNLTVNLDFIDSLFVVVTRLIGPVDWKQIERDLVQTEAIIADMNDVPGTTATSFISLRYAAMKRLPYLIKQEVHDLLARVLEEARERSSKITPWFPSDYHSLFIKVSMDLWSLELQERTGVKSMEDPERIQGTIDSLHRAVSSYTGIDSLESFSIEEPDKKLLRSTLFKWVALLNGTPFSADKE